MPCDCPEARENKLDPDSKIHQRCRDERNPNALRSRQDGFEEGEVHIDAAGLVLAGSSMFETGKRLAVAGGVGFAIGVVAPTLGLGVGSALGNSPSRFIAQQMRVLGFLGWIGLAVAAVGLVMMVKGFG